VPHRAFAILRPEKTTNTTVLLCFRPLRRQDLANSIVDQGSLSTFIEFFQVHEGTGTAKGIIVIDLERLQL
jgi:hypothetical protein